MKKKVEANITPDVLRWARVTIGLELEDAANKLKVKLEDLKEWEAGARKPTFSKLQRIADVYKRPTATFYLPKPPADARAPKDFRRLPINKGRPFSKALRLSFRETQVRQEFARELRVEEEFKPLAFVRSATLSMDPEKVAAKVRENIIGIDAETQWNWSDNLEAFNEWRIILEAAGCLIFQTSDAPFSEMRGYSLRDDIAPVITLNAKDEYQGRTFTLMHELGHLVLDDGGLCDLAERQRDGSLEGKTEVFCNAFAAALLMPHEKFLSMLAMLGLDHGSEHRWTDDELRKVAGKFKVSREAILRRLLTLGRTTQDHYARMRERFLEEYKELAVRKKKKKGFMRPHQKSVRNNGRTFTQIALEAYHHEEITSRELSDYLGVKVDQIDKVIGEL